MVGAENQEVRPKGAQKAEADLDARPTPDTKTLQKSSELLCLVSGFQLEQAVAAK